MNNRTETKGSQPSYRYHLMVAITAVLAGVLYVWASSLADDSTGGGLDTTSSTAETQRQHVIDAGDALVHQDDTRRRPKWSVLRVSIVATEVITCAEAPDADAACTYSIDDDNIGDRRDYHQ